MHPVLLSNFRVRATPMHLDTRNQRIATESTYLDGEPCSFLFYLSTHNVQAQAPGAGAPKSINERNHVRPQVACSVLLGRTRVTSGEPRVQRLVGQLCSLQRLRRLPRLAASSRFW